MKNKTFVVRLDQIIMKRNKKDLAQNVFGRITSCFGLFFIILQFKFEIKE